MVVFDIGNVVVRWSIEDLIRPLCDTDAQWRAFASEVLPPEQNARVDAGMAISAFVAERSRLFPWAAPLMAAWGERWDETVPDEVPGTAAIVSELHRNGVAVAGLSNFNGETFDRTVERFPVLKLLDPVVISADIGVCKPDPAIYLHLCARLDVAPEQCVFIDDSPANVEAAAELGMTAIHFTSADALRLALRADGFL